MDDNDDDDDMDIHDYWMAVSSVSINIIWIELNLFNTVMKTYKVKEYNNILFANVGYAMVTLPKSSLLGGRAASF